MGGSDGTVMNAEYKTGGGVGKVWTTTGWEVLGVVVLGVVRVTRRVGVLETDFVGSLETTLVAVLSVDGAGLIKNGTPSGGRTEVIAYAFLCGS
jgi:hypothetical protein